MVAACAGLPYGMSEAVRQLQEVRRPVLLVCVEKFSDKIGAVRPSRMIFGDGAAAMVIAPAADGQTGDVEVLQTYASGPHSEVNSIIWPNSEFDGDITVYRPEVKALVQRYLMQMLGELGAQPDPDGEGRTLLESIELIIPHQANKTMILNLAGKAGLSADQLYFNVERMGNVSAASIPIAVYDAVRDGVITEPVRVFAPGFGAGAVGGYALMRIDPAIVADEVVLDVLQDADRAGARAAAGSTSDDIRAAFGVKRDEPPCLPFPARRDRQPGRAGHAADQRRPGVERRGTARAARHRRVHGRRPARDIRPRGRRVRADRPGRGRRGLRREPLPGLRRAGARAACLPGGCGLARLGVRLGEGRVRRAVRPARDHLHRPVGRGDAAGRRQKPKQGPGPGDL